MTVEPGSKLVIDASDTVHIDQDVTDLINDFETNATFQGNRGRTTWICESGQERFGSRTC